MIPDKLSADYSENYKVSIRLMSDGLSFWGYIPDEKDSFFMETFLFDPILPAVDSLHHIFFANPCLSFIYQSFYVMNVSAKYTLVADPVFIDQEKERLFFFCHPKDTSLKVLVQPLRSMNVSILFGMDKDIYAFLFRSLANPQFILSLSPLMVAWIKKSRMIFPKLMHVVINTYNMDVLCVEHGDLLFVNSYNYENHNDVIYYLMYICKQTGFNQLEDYLTVSGDKTVCLSVLSVISKYVKKTDYLQPKLNNYQAAVDPNMSLDMIALLECGL